jgi:hypothetical protein
MGPQANSSSTGTDKPISREDRTKSALLIKNVDATRTYDAALWQFEDTRSRPQS